MAGVILDRYRGRPERLAEVAACHRAWVELKRRSGTRVSLDDEVLLDVLTELESAETTVAKEAV